MKRFLLLAALIILVALPAHAVDYITTMPHSSTNLSGTVAVTNTFQSIQTLNGSRFGCFVQNNSATNNMWVFAGPVANATKGQSAVLQPGQYYSCQTASNVLSDQISITGTSGDSFTANFQ